MPGRQRHIARPPLATLRIFLRHKRAVEMAPRGASAHDSARASLSERRAHRPAEILDRAADDRCDLRRTGDLHREKSKLAVTFEPRARLGLLARESEDAFESLAGRAFGFPSIVAMT